MWILWTNYELFLEIIKKWKSEYKYNFLDKINKILTL